MRHKIDSQRYCFVLVLLIAAFIAGSSPMAAGAQAPRDTDQIIVKPRPGRDLAAVHARSKGQLKKKVAIPGGELHVVKLPPGLTLAEALAHYRGSDDVEYAEPDSILRMNATPNDPRYADGTQWSLNNLGQNGGQNDADIDAPEAWNIQSGADNVIVAVVDTGVRYTHEDLAANMWRNPGEIPDNGIDDDHNGYTDDVHGVDLVYEDGYPIDENGHGSHVAGIIAGVGNNGRGIAGVAWRAKIMALKFLDANGEGYTSDSVIAIDYARAKGASVINASFAGPENSISLRDAISRAGAAGIIVAAAAGNDAANNDVVAIYPANYGLDNLVSVAATTSADTKADFSNYGSRTVHLGAPGYNIYSAYASADNGYVYMSGTSMAAPHVAGALALLRAHFPTNTYRQIIDRLLNNVDPLPALAGKCTTGGRLNLQRALQTNASTGIPVTLALSPESLPWDVRLRVTGVAGQLCGIEESVDLKNWSQIGAVTVGSNGSVEVILDATRATRNFYRARLY